MDLVLEKIQLCRTPTVDWFVFVKDLLALCVLKYETKAKTSTSSFNERQQRIASIRVN